MDSKKLFSAFAVIVMLFAGCTAIAACADASADAKTVEINNTVKITKDGIDEHYLKLFGATYDNDNHVLTFKEDVVIRMTDDPVYEPMIEVAEDMGKIVMRFDADVMFTSEPTANLHVIMASRCHLVLCGSGSVTFDFPYTQEFAITNTAMHADYIEIDGCTVNVVLPELNPSTMANGGQLIIVVYEMKVVNATLKIDAGKSMARSNTMQFIYLVNGTVKFLDSTVELILPALWQGYFEAICCNDVLIDGSVLRVRSPENPEEVVGNLICISAQLKCDITDSVIDFDLLECKGEKYEAIDGCSKGIVIDSSIVDIDMVGLDANGYVIYSTGHGTIANSRMRISAADYMYGFQSTCGLNISGSDVDVHAKKNSIGTDPLVIGAVDKILGSDGKSEPTEEVERPDNCAWSHIVGWFTVGFDLGIGTGTEVNPVRAHTGDSVTLPNCDATWEGKPFIGWTDGEHMYKAGQQYDVTLSAKLTAIYWGQPGPVPPAPSGGDNDGIVALAICGTAFAIMFAIAVGAAIYQRK